MIITKQEVLMIHAHDHNLQVVFVVLVLLFFLLMLQGDAWCHACRGGTARAGTIMNLWDWIFCVLNCFCVGVLVSFFKNLISITLTVENKIQHIQARNSPKTTH